MSTSFRDKAFQGLQDGFKDPIDFIEDIETAERDYAREISTPRSGKNHGEAAAKRGKRKEQ
ncbi:uncharacterized protein N7518_000260 [Penicillium psychrosexuale]|uniref:uncharacterized protein n=1 Tax=Penicillium psychrosexuale TaxID=1002107 RepID=UPI002545949A|nr:uncharacterized protein N7518_000260 [Penicillium psychrosexuale]KAJ5803957.1 hypothetical protein N7518_000260 [Penicillium psychrosexuale]